MADNQPTNGFFTRVSNSLLEALLINRIPGQEMRVILAVLRKTHGYGREQDQISYGQIAKLTDIPRVRVIRHVKALVSKKILGSLNNGTRQPLTLWINTNSEEWAPSPKKETSPKEETRPSLNKETKPSLNKGTHKRKKEKRKKRPDPPFDKIVDLYHEILPQLPGVKKLTPARMTQLKARWYETEKTCCLEWWEKYFKYVAQCPFLLGDNGKGWSADLEWITKESNFTKVIEGKYHKN